MKGKQSGTNFWEILVIVIFVAVMFIGGMYIWGLMQ